MFFAGNPELAGYDPNVAVVTEPVPRHMGLDGYVEATIALSTADPTSNIVFYEKFLFGNEDAYIIESIVREDDYVGKVLQVVTVEDGWSRIFQCTAFERFDQCMNILNTVKRQLTPIPRPTDPPIPSEPTPEPERGDWFVDTNGMLLGSYDYGSVPPHDEPPDIMIACVQGQLGFAFVGNDYNIADGTSALNVAIGSDDAGTWFETDYGDTDIVAFEGSEPEFETIIHLIQEAEKKNQILSITAIGNTSADQDDWITMVGYFDPAGFTTNYHQLVCTHKASLPE